MKVEYLQKLNEIKLSVELMYLHNDSAKIEAISLINELILEIDEDIYSSSVIQAVKKINWEKEIKLATDIIKNLKEKL